MPKREVSYLSNQVVTRTTNPRKIVTETEVVADSDLWLAKTNQVIWFFLILIEILLGFRIFLKILGASSLSGFASFIYALSSPLAAPFFGILNPSFGPQGSVVEWSTILAAVVYAVIAWIIVYLIQILHPAHPNHVSSEEIIED